MYGKKYSRHRSVKDLVLEPRLVWRGTGGWKFPENFINGFVATSGMCLRKNFLAGLFSKN